MLNFDFVNLLNIAGAGQDYRRVYPYILTALENADDDTAKEILNILYTYIKVHTDFFTYIPKNNRDNIWDICIENNIKSNKLDEMISLGEIDNLYNTVEKYVNVFKEINAEPLNEKMKKLLNSMSQEEFDREWEKILDLNLPSAPDEDD